MIDKTKWKNIESSKTVYGTLTEARNMLKQHDVDRLHENVNVPTKCTLKDVTDGWNRNIGDINTEKTTQTSKRNLQRHMMEFFQEVRVNKVTATLILEYILNTLFNYAMLHDAVYGLYKNPMDKVKPLKVDYKGEVYIRWMLKIK